MPVEIRELVIRTIVEDKKDASPSTAASSEGNSDREALINDCVEQVMQLLREQQER